MSIISNSIRNNYISSAYEWLIQARDLSSDGWGVWEKSDATITNTAEALIALSYMDSIRAQGYVGKAIAFISKMVETRKPTTTRHYALALTSLALCGIHQDPLVEKCYSWLLTTRADDGGWGHSHNDKKSSLFPTYLGIRALVAFVNKLSDIELKNKTIGRINQAERWIIDTQNEDGGWSFEFNQVSNAAMTSYALTSLALAHSIEDGSAIPQKIWRGYNFLNGILATKNFENVMEKIPNSQLVIVPYVHLTPALMLMAYTKQNELIHGIDVYKLIANLLDLQDKGSYAWTDGYNTTVWATAMALTSIMQHKQNYQYELDIPLFSYWIVNFEDEKKRNSKLIKELEELNPQKQGIVLRFYKFWLALNMPAFIFFTLAYIVINIGLYFYPPTFFSKYVNGIAITVSIIFGIFPYLYSRQRLKLNIFNSLVASIAIVSFILSLLQIIFKYP